MDLCVLMSLTWSLLRACPACCTQVTPLPPLCQPAESPAPLWAKTLFSFRTFSLWFPWIIQQHASSSFIQGRKSVSHRAHKRLCAHVHKCVCVSVSAILWTCLFVLISSALVWRKTWECICVCVLRGCDTASFCWNLSCEMTGCVLLFGPGLLLLMSLWVWKGFEDAEMWHSLISDHIIGIFIRSQSDQVCFHHLEWREETRTISWYRGLMSHSTAANIIIDA